MAALWPLAERDKRPRRRKEKRTGVKRVHRGAHLGLKCARPTLAAPLSASESRKSLCCVAVAELPVVVVSGANGAPTMCKEWLTFAPAAN